MNEKTEKTEKTENQNFNFLTEHFFAEESQTLSSEGLSPEESNKRRQIPQQNSSTQRRLLRKKTLLQKMAQSSLSIITVNPPRSLFEKIEELNTFFIKCNTMLYNKQITAKEILEIRQKIKDLAEKSWNLLGQVFHVAFIYPISNWAQLNDDLNTKQTIVKQYWTRALGINPTVDEVAMLAIVLKYLCQLRKKVRLHGDYALAETLIKLRETMEEGIKEILDYANGIVNKNKQKSENFDKQL